VVKGSLCFWLAKSRQIEKLKIKKSKKKWFLRFSVARSKKKKN
jgi:hypothetical protein